jgi:hypothetical protein
MVSYLDLAVVEAKRKTRLQDAEYHRLVRQAMAGRERGRSYRVRILGWTGDRLVGAGLYLQNRYGACVDVAKEAVSNRKVDSVPTAW